LPSRSGPRTKWRFQIYGEMWSLCSEYPDFMAADLLSNDPLRLFQLFVRNISTSATTDVNRAISYATDAYGSFRQGSSMSVADLKREFVARLRNFRDLGGTMPSSELQAISFMSRLDTARYNGLLNNPTGGVQVMPRNLVDAYRMASMWVMSSAEVNRVQREMALATTAVGYTSSERHTVKQRAPGGGVDAKSAVLPSTKKLLCWCPVFKKVSEIKVEARGLVASATATFYEPSEQKETEVDCGGFMFINYGCS
jgi:hypothetical protein